MTRPSTVEVVVKVDGSPLADDLMATLVSLRAEDSVHVPGAIELAFEDERAELAQGGAPFPLGAKVEVKLGAAGEGDATFTAEVVATTRRVEHKVFTTLVRCHDAMHKLSRARMTKTFENMTISEVVSKLAGTAGVPTAKVDATSAKYPFISVVNETPYEALRRLERLAGHQASVDDKGKLSFTRLERTGTPVEVTWEECIELEVTNTAASIPKEVVAKGWDPAQKKEVTHTAQVATKLAQAKHTPASAASKLSPASGKVVVTGHHPLLQAAEAKALATSVAEQLGASVVEVHGTLIGKPALRAGGTVKLGTDLGAGFVGEHRVTSTVHRYAPGQGYTTEFSVTGQRDRTLTGLLHGGATNPRALGGLVTGIVTDNKDKTDQGRVRVSFPWLDAEHVSGWARVAYPGAGNKRGVVQRPSVNDEVLVGFEHGDPGSPVVLGGLYNGKDKLPDAKAPEGGKNLQTGLYTDKFQVSVYDKDQKLVVSDVEAQFTITVDSKSKAITISSGKDIKLEAKGDISMKATGKISLEATQDFAAKGLNVALDAQAKLSGKGAAGLDLSSSAIASLKGSLTKLG